MNETDLIKSFKYELQSVCDKYINLFNHNKWEVNIYMNCKVKKVDIKNKKIY